MIELINKIIRDYDLPLSKQYHDESCDFESRVIDAFMDFGKQVCELQKKECANIGYNFGNSARDVVQEEILNCKNVCTT